jgi:hypothetical protein
VLRTSVTAGGMGTGPDWQRSHSNCISVSVSSSEFTSLSVPTKLFLLNIITGDIARRIGGEGRVLAAPSNIKEFELRRGGASAPEAHIY